MLKPSILNIIFFWFAKYFAFYILMMFKNNNYALIEFGNVKTGEDLFYYAWMFLFLPILFTVILAAPLYLSFKVKSQLNHFLIIGGILVVEYILYTLLASTSNFLNGVLNLIVSVGFYLLFFFKHAKGVSVQQT